MCMLSEMWKFHQFIQILDNVCSLCLFVSYDGSIQLCSKISEQRQYSKFKKFYNYIAWVDDADFNIFKVTVVNVNCINITQSSELLWPHVFLLFSNCKCVIIMIMLLQFCCSIQFRWTFL